MAKHVLFLVHGIGKHPLGWTTAERGPVDTLSGSALHYADFTAQRPLQDSVEFVEIRYDDIFDRIMERWSELGASLQGRLPEATPAAIAEISDTLRGAADPDNWFASHAMDAVLYTSFKLIRRLVQLRVAATIMRRIGDGAEGQRFSLLAHSLGTTVAHDAIHRMATTPWLSDSEGALDALDAESVGAPVSAAQLERARARYGNNPFKPGLFKLDGVFMISNTSALLQQTARNAFESTVRPAFSGAGSAENSCLRYFNIDHRFDPISKVRRFRAAEAWPRAVTLETAKDVFDIEHVHDVNVHALDHYLTHPRVHAEILRVLCPARFTAADAASAEARVEPGGDFPRWGDKYTDEDLQDELLDRLEALRQRGRDALATILERLPRLIETIRGRLPS